MELSYKVWAIQSFLFAPAAEPNPRMFEFKSRRSPDVLCLRERDDLSMLLDIAHRGGWEVSLAIAPEDPDALPLEALWIPVSSLLSVRARDGNIETGLPEMDLRDALGKIVSSALNEYVRSAEIDELSWGSELPASTVKQVLEGKNLQLGPFFRVCAAAGVAPRFCFRASGSNLSRKRELEDSPLGDSIFQNGISEPGRSAYEERLQFHGITLAVANS